MTWSLNGRFNVEDIDTAIDGLRPSPSDLGAKQEAQVAAAREVGKDLAHAASGDAPRLQFSASGHAPPEGQDGYSSLAISVSECPAEERAPQVADDASREGAELQSPDPARPPAEAQVAADAGQGV